MEQELDLLQYWRILKKRWLIIIALPLIAALISGVISSFVLKPVYQASTTLIVGKKAAEEGSPQAGQLLEYNVLMANQQLAKTYGAIAKSRTVEEKVINKLGLSVTAEDLDSKIAVEPLKNTEVLAITVEDNDPAIAAQIANAMAMEFSASVIDIKKVDSVSIIDNAVPPEKPVKPKKMLNVLIAMAIGIMVSVGLAFLLEFLDNTIKDEKDVEDFMGLPVLGLIPHYKGDEL